jgi:hypothetical protein
MPLRGPLSGRPDIPQQPPALRRYRVVPAALARAAAGNLHAETPRQQTPARNCRRTPHVSSDLANPGHGREQRITRLACGAAQRREGIGHQGSRAVQGGTANTASVQLETHKLMQTPTGKVRACVWACALLFLGAGRTGHPSPLFVPIAQTITGITVTATLEGTTILASPDAYSYAVTTFGATSVASNRVPQHTVQIGSADGSANATAAPVLTSGAQAGGAIAIATMHTAGSTLAEAATPQALFARSASFSAAGVSGVQVSPGSSPVLNLSWNVASLALQSQPTASFSFVQNMVTVFQTPVGSTVSAPVTTSVGLALLGENGLTSVLALDAPGTQSISDWMSGNLAQSGGIVSLIPNAAPDFTVAVPLGTGSAGGSDGTQSYQLEVRVTQTAYSTEAPPAATQRVAEQAGATTSEPTMRWDAENGTLTFARLPINILSNGGADAIDPIYGNDPLAGAYLDIGTLRYLREANGRTYFAGHRLTITSADGEVLFAASLPSIAFDDSFFSSTGFDLFAPILEILQEDAAHSAWLRAFDARNTIDSWYLPELFIGFTPPGDGNFWADSFRAVPTAVLSFSGPRTAIPAPSTVSILCVGLAGLTLAWRLRRPASARPE